MITIAPRCVPQRQDMSSPDTRAREHQFWAGCHTILGVMSLSSLAHRVCVRLTNRPAAARATLLRRAARPPRATTWASTPSARPRSTVRAGRLAVVTVGRADRRKTLARGCSRGARRVQLPPGGQTCGRRRPTARCRSSRTASGWAAPSAACCGRCHRSGPRRTSSARTRGAPEAPHIARSAGTKAPQSRTRACTGRRAGRSTSLRSACSTAKSCSPARRTCPGRLGTSAARTWHAKPRRPRRGR
mmetsp:Transcript_6856/g.16116  ORF Transcript_6856/g.16116 Transcript_6856/m.16116 type:complete len:245 (+) Transcript_6856:110-844(+)